MWPTFVCLLCIPILQPDLMLTSQLKALKDSSGYLYLDEALTVDSSSTKQQQQQKRTWETFEAFEEHVCSTYLVGAAGVACSAALSPRCTVVEGFVVGFAGPAACKQCSAPPKSTFPPSQQIFTICQYRLIQP